MSESATGLGCPTCWNNGQGVKSMLFSRQGKFAYYCRTGHEFNDLPELLALDPPKLPVPQKHTQQEGHVQVQLAIPEGLKNTLLQKFGSPEKLSQSLAGILRTLSESQCFMFNEIDIDRVGQIAGSRPKNGSELVGIIHAKNEKIKELEAARGTPAGQQAQSTSVGVPEGKLLIDASEFLPRARALANFRNQTVEQVCEGTLKLALENGWA